jgi:hypothetical protein
MPYFVDKEYILERVPEEEIFERFGMPVDKGVLYSILRHDKKPTCTFKILNNRLILKDWNGHFMGDCFAFVMKKEKCSFPEALYKIAESIDLDNREPYRRIEVQKVSSIKIKRMHWTPEHYAYWCQYGVSMETLEYFKVYPIFKAWYNDAEIYTYSKGDEAFAYHFYEYNYQLYFPLRDRKSLRFMNSEGFLVHGFEQLPKTGDLLVITKSRKDIMCLYEFGIPAICPKAESIILSEEFIESLHKRFKTVVSLMDYDNTGIHNAWVMRKVNNVKPYFFTEGLWKRKQGYLGAKDTSDFVQFNKPVKFQQLCQILLHSVQLKLCTNPEAD